MVTQLVTELVQAQAVDKLHHVVMLPALVADSEYGHDVRVMEAARRLGLAIEPFHLFLVVQDADRQHLERDPAAQYLLLGFVHHPHSTPADLANDPEAGDCRNRARGSIDVRQADRRSGGPIVRALAIDGIHFRTVVVLVSRSLGLEFLRAGRCPPR